MRTSLGLGAIFCVERFSELFGQYDQWEFNGKEAENELFFRWEKDGSCSGTGWGLEF